MRKIVYLFITVLTCYMAGVFRSVPLMALSGMEAVLFAAAFLQSRYLKTHLSAEALRHWESIEKSAWLACRIKLKNTGKLPVSRFQIKLRYGYAREAGYAGRQKNAGAKYIDGSCGRGESTVSMEVAGRYCGIMTLHMVRMRVYDYLSLFSCARKMDGTVEAAVYPQEKALQLELLFPEEGEDGLLQERISNRGGENGGEVRQLREYQSGDSSRYIHWNQTARTGQLWVKEYEKEADSCIRLFLDTDGMEEADETERDAFYELVSALVLGLLKRTTSVLVGWYDGSGRMADMEVGTGEQCRELLLRLYRRGLPGQEYDARAEWKPENRSPGEGLKLDMRLGMYRNDTLLYTFSVDNLEEQIAEGKYVL